MNRDKLLNALTGIMVVAALLVAVLVVRQQFFPRAAQRGGFEVQSVRDWATLAAVGHSQGPANAPVTIVEFADFECPACRVFAPTLDSALMRDSAGIRFVFRHLPLPRHRFAMRAARASECAADQSRFFEMYKALFTYQDSLGIRPWTWYAQTAGVPDTARFSTCVKSDAPMAAVARDSIAAEGLGIRGTPTVLINEFRFTGAISRAELDTLISRARAGRPAGKIRG